MFSVTVLRRFVRVTAVARASQVSSGVDTRGPRGPASERADPSSRRSAPQADGSTPPIPRLHGTVTGFKHRRGYGFVLAEGVVDEALAPADASALMTTYFFTRHSLMGGYYITEGERVAFDVEKRTKRKPGKVSRQQVYVALSDDEASARPSGGSDGGSADGATGESAQALNLACRMRMFDLKTLQESPVLPIGLQGKVVRWDAESGTGVIGELDMQRKYHPDSPRFSLSQDDVDVTPGVEMRTGRYVRFCVGTEDASATAEEPAEGTEGENAAPSRAVEMPAARRVIIDRAMEQRMAVVGRPLVPASAERGTVTPLTRFRGVVRELRADFGFVRDELSGESIFFHASEVRAAELKPGEHVTYMLRELTRGKHAGKKACFQLRRERHSLAGDENDEAQAPQHGEHTSAGRQRSAAKSKNDLERMLDSDEDDFDLLD